MRTRRFVNRSESITLHQLERVLEGTAYRAYVKPRLKDAIEPTSGEALTFPERRMLDYGHLDFLVVERTTHRPEFAVEFDGPSHADPKQGRRDATKDGLCLRSNLPVLRLTTEEIAPREQCSVLEWLLERFVDYRRAYPVQWDPDGYAWAPFPDWNFDLDHTMPAISAVLQRLHRRFGIVAENWWAWGGDRASLGPRSTAALSVLPDTPYLDSLGLLPPDMSSPTTVPFEETGEAKLVLLRRGQSEPVHMARGRIVIRERSLVHGGMLDQIFGFSYTEAQACLAEYLALKDLERFAMRHLVPLAA